MPQSFTLTFDSKTLDYIANVLGTRPYAEVAAVLQSIATQVSAQQGPHPVLTESATAGNGAEPGQPVQ